MRTSYDYPSRNGSIGKKPERWLRVHTRRWSGQKITSVLARNDTACRRTRRGGYPILMSTTMSTCRKTICESSNDPAPASTSQTRAPFKITEKVGHSYRLALPDWDESPRRLPRRPPTQGSDRPVAWTIYRSPSPADDIRATGMGGQRDTSLTPSITTSCSIRSPG